MKRSELEQLKRLLAALHETEIPPDTERRLVAGFQRLWPPRKVEDRAEPGGEEIGPQRGSQEL